MRTIYRIGFLIIFWSSASQVVAQNFYNKSGTTVSISSAGIISVKDSLINEGTLINNGNMAVGGTWLNLGTYDAGEGQITFNSTDTSVPQVINHNNQSFSKLVISGGGVKEIRGNMRVTESLTLTDGIITTPNQSKIHFEELATITGGSDNSHINTPVYQLGSGTKLFPVGNGVKYLPVTITGIPSVSEIGIILTELPSPQDFNTNSSLSDISEKRYWVVDVFEGSLEGAKITLPIAGDEDLEGSESEFVVAYATGATEDFQTLGRGVGSSAAFIESGNSPSSGVVTLAVPSDNQSIVVFNAISPTPGDEINDYIRIENLVESDVVSIYNRWGDLVFEMKNYVNDDVAKRFNGLSNIGGGGKDLPAGNYFYVIRRKAGKEVSGYLSLRK